VGLTLIRCELGSDGILDTYSWFTMMWKDDYLKWNPSEFGGQTAISIPAEDIWIPDIMLYNSADVQQMNNLGTTNVIIQSTGDVLWVPPFAASTFCDVDYSHWPFDKQSCKIKIGSWTRDNKQLALQIKPAEKEWNSALEYYQQGSWEVTDVTSKQSTTEYPCCPGLGYDDITYTLKLTRISVFDQIIATVPSIVVCFTTLVTFWISPKTSSNKLMILITDILITTFVIFSIRGILPFAAGKVPHVVIFYTLTLLLQSASILIAVVTANLAEKKTPVPSLLKKLHSGFLGKALCIGTNTEQSANEKPASDAEGAEMKNVIGENHVPTNGIKNHNSVKSDWHLVAVAFDRIFFQWLLGNFVFMYVLYL